MRQHSSCFTVSEMLDQAVTDRRNHGFTMDAAIKQVADFFSISTSKVKKFIFYGENELPELRQIIHARYLDHLQAQQDHLQRQLETVKKRLREIS